MNAHYRQVNVVEQLVVKFDAHARAEKDHDLFLAVLFEEGKEQQKALL